MDQLRPGYLCNSGGGAITDPAVYITHNIPDVKLTNKNKFLDKLAANSWGVRAGPPIIRSPGGPTLKKNKKIFLVVVAH